MSQTLRFYKIAQLHVASGKYLNSPVLEEWRDCGFIEAENQDEAYERARLIIGNGNAVCVESVEAFERPE